MFDVITFGSATEDILLRSKAFKVTKDDKDFVTGEGICLSLGSKIDVDDIQYSTGGGGTNAAATFANQGFKVAFCGVVGEDEAAGKIVGELKELGVDTTLVFRTKEKMTNYSVIISSDGQDRTILAYRGASDLLRKENIPFSRLKTKWIYLAPLSGMSFDDYKYIVNYAFENKIKIAINPGNVQLDYPIKELEEIFKKVDVLFLNQEEASFITKISFHDEASIFKKIDEICPGIAVMTKGADGVTASDGKYLYNAVPHEEIKVVDATGAGDAFCAGFLSDYIKTNGDIEKAIQLGIANSEANLKQVGAKTGILKKDAIFDRVKVWREVCSENNLCIVK